MPIWTILEWAALVVQAALVGLAIRLYRLKRMTSFRLLMLACISLVIAQSSWFTSGFVAGFAGHELDSIAYATISEWGRRINITFRLLSFVLLAGALNYFVREHKANATRNV